MFKPNIQLNTEILSNISAIERYYGRLESLNLPRELLLNLEQRNLLYSSYVSNSIEGNTMSLPEVTNLITNDRVPVNHEEKEVKNYFAILRQLPNWVGKPVSIETILQIHAQLIEGVQDTIAGEVRDTRVVVGKYGTGKELEVKHEPPFHSRYDIEKALEELATWLEKSEDPPMLKASLFHHQFLYIHPFVDGNGRTCRLLTALLLLQNGYQINKYFVLDDWYDVDRKQYSDKLHTADSGKHTEWVDYFTAGVRYSLYNALARAEEAADQMSVKSRLSKREKEVYALLQVQRELTTAQVVEELGVSRQYGQRLLAGLVKKGFAKKHGSTKAGYYSMA